jgi:hypothetical protein
MHIFTTGVCCTPRGKGITGITSILNILKNI